MNSDQSRSPVAYLFCIALFWLAASINVNAAEKVPLQINVDDAQGEPLPCRVHLINKQGVPQKAPKQPFWRGHFVCSGDVVVNVLPGEYTWEIERGPEHERSAGTINIAAGKTAQLDVTLKRIAHLRNQGWYSGDLHVHRPIDEIEKLMLAEDLDFAPVITWWNHRLAGITNPPETTIRFDGHRLYTIMAGEDEREGGALLYFNLKKPLDLTAVTSREFPSPMRFHQQAQRQNKGVWTDIEKPFWWDVPTWLASGQMNSIGLANNHMNRSQMYRDEAWGKPRDLKRFPEPRGNGYWTQEIYYHILNTGLRIPPSAGSASGVLPNPVGYNRVYVYVGQGDRKQFSKQAWFESLSQGKCFVTNGPLLQVKANDQLPGSIMQLSDDAKMQIKLDINLTSLDRVPAIEVIHNGKVVKTIDCSSETTQHKIITFNVKEPGWFLVRAITDVKHTFRFASTAPWYIEADSKTESCSRKSAQFFLDWVNQRIDRIRTNVKNKEQLNEVLKWHFLAREFWTKRVQSATRD